MFRQPQGKFFGSGEKPIVFRISLMSPMQQSCTYVIVVSVVMSGMELRVVKCVRRGIIFGQGHRHKSDQCKHRNLRNIRVKSSTVEMQEP